MQLLAMGHKWQREREWARGARMEQAARTGAGQWLERQAGRAPLEGPLCHTGNVYENCQINIFAIDQSAKESNKSAAVGQRGRRVAGWPANSGHSVNHVTVLEKVQKSF